MGIFTTSAEVIPTCRVTNAIARGVEKNILFCVGGGIGDQICAEPTLRFAFENFRDCSINLFAYNRELFNHLPFHKSFDTLTFEQSKNYFLVPTYPLENAFSDQFFTSNSTNAVDFISLHSIRMQLPCKFREIWIQPKSTWDMETDIKAPVFVHAGKSWPSKTFPKLWWDCLLEWILHTGMTPVLIGKIDCTVDVNTKGCLDLRDKLSLMDSIRVLQSADVMVTNDSSPLHMAATRNPLYPTVTGHAWINFIATAKHPDLVTHYRHGKWGYRMVNHSRGGLWQQNLCMNRSETLNIKEIDEATLVSWLPDPQQLAETMHDQHRALFTHPND